MKSQITALPSLLFTSLLAVGLFASAIASTAQIHNLVSWQPQKNDVCMRFFSRERLEEAFEVGKKLHIDCVVWSYFQDKPVIAAIAAQGWAFQGTVNAFTDRPELALHDENGTPIESHIPKRYWADPENPEYFFAAVVAAKKWIDLGVYSLQRDDPTFGEWHHGRKIPDSVLSKFHKNFRDELERYAKRSVYITTNSSESRLYLASFDAKMVELQQRQAITQDWSSRISTNQPITFTLGKRIPLEQMRLMFAFAYATGNTMLIPWDQFDGDAHESRYVNRVFIDPVNIVDLTAFIRIHRNEWRHYDQISALHEMPSQMQQSISIDIEETDKIAAYLWTSSITTSKLIHLVQLQPLTTGKLGLHQDFLQRPSEQSLTLCHPLVIDPQQWKVAKGSEPLIQQQTCYPITGKLDDKEFVQFNIPVHAQWLTLKIQ